MTPLLSFSPCSLLCLFNTWVVQQSVNLTSGLNRSALALSCQTFSRPLFSGGGIGSNSFHVLYLAGIISSTSSKHSDHRFIDLSLKLSERTVNSDPPPPFEHGSLLRYTKSTSSFILAHLTGTRHKVFVVVMAPPVAVMRSTCLIIDLILS